MHDLLRTVHIVDVVADMSNDGDHRILATVSLNRKLMSCEVVHTLGGYVIKLYDSWIFQDGGNFRVASDWKYADVPCEDGPLVSACWIKQKNNYLIELTPEESYPMTRNPVKIMVDKDKGMIQYFSEKEVLNQEFEISGLMKLLDESGEGLLVAAVALLNHVCEALKISERIANEI
jgi:hypothetical protein